jgi:hypothetical protein
MSEIVRKTLHLATRIVIKLRQIGHSNLASHLHQLNSEPTARAHSVEPVV